MNLNKAADLVEKQGRFGDTELVHLNPLEVKMLEKFTPGGKLTRNPVTGKKEAFLNIVLAIASIVSTGAGIVASKKNREAQEEMAQEAAYIEGGAPLIPNANQLAIETIGDAPSPETAAPDFREALADTYGGDVYETQGFQSEQIPPELLEALMQQQMSGPEPTNVQFANSGGPVGLPQDVYQFPVEKISQMQMDVDPGVRNVGNAMMAQMEGNPGMGMVSASAADIDQMAAGGPVQPRRYADGSEGGLGIFAMLDQTAGAEGRPTGGDMELEYLRETRDTPSEDPFSLENIKEEMRIKEAEERSRQFLEQEGPLRRPTTFSKEDAQRLADAGVFEPSALEQLLNRIGTTAQKKGFGIERRFDEGPLEMFLKARRDRKTSVPPALGPQMRSEGGSVRPKKYQEGSEGGIGELYKKIPTNLRLFGEYLAGVESPITEKDFTTEELDLIRNQIIAQKINNEVLEDEYRKAGDADAVETFKTTRGRTSVSPYDIQESGLPRTKTTFGRSYLSGGSGSVDKGWEDALRSLDDPRYTVATSLGKYTAEDVDDGFRIRENYDFNRGASDRPSPIQDVESFDQLKNLLTNMQATPEVVGETLANLIKSDPRAVDIRL